MFPGAFRKIIGCAVFLLWVWFHGVGWSDPRVGPIRVATSIYPVADMVKQIGGDRVDVHSLLSPNSNPHTFEPTPRQMEWLAGADLFFLIGQNMEFWAKRIVENVSGGKLEVVDLSRSIDRLDSEGNLLPRDSAQLGDPHYWLSVPRAKVMCGVIADRLARLSPDDAPYFQERLKGYREALDGLDAEIRREVGGFRQKKFLSVHPAFIYFAREYGLEQMGALKETPGKEPSPKHVAELIRLGRAENVKVVIVVAHDNPMEGRVLAEEVGAVLVSLNTLGGPDMPGRSHYLDLMRYNLDLLKKGMGQ